MTRKPSNSTWLDSVEGLSLVGAVLGTVAGLAFQQLIYVSAPLALALVMNFVNRQRHEEELERSLGDRVVETRLEVERQFEDELSRVREEASLTPEEGQTTTNEDLLAVQEQLQQLQVQSQQPMVAVEELQQQISTLSTQVSRALANLENLGTGVATGMLQGVVTPSKPVDEPKTSESVAEDVASPEAFWKQYQQGVRQFARLNLPEVDFSQQREYLNGVDFSQANLQGAKLMGLNLGDSMLKAANLNEAKLDYGNLSRAQLQNASLVGANLRGANLRHADLRGANLENADLSYADVTDANFEGANLKGVKFFRSRGHEQALQLQFVEAS